MFDVIYLKLTPVTDEQAQNDLLLLSKTHVYSHIQILWNQKAKWISLQSPYFTFI